MWRSRSRNDLIIEVWEKLDCENVGAAEIEAIETVIIEQYGSSAVDSPMVIARLLADEGAELRHSEIMALYIERASDRPYDAALRNVIKIENLKSTATTIRNLDNLRRKYTSLDDKAGVRLVRETALCAKQTAAETAGRLNIEPVAKAINAEIAMWFTIWLQTPDVFEDWLALRQRSAEFIDKFGDDSQR